MKWRKYFNNEGIVFAVTIVTIAVVLSAVLFALKDRQRVVSVYLKTRTDTLSSEGKDQIRGVLKKSTQKSFNDKAAGGAF